MNKIIRLMQNYLLIGAPFVIACMLWQTYNPDIHILAGTSAFINILWTALAMNLMLWFAMLALFLAGTVIMPRFREKTLNRLANLQEKDEREQYITGQAARTTYISTLGLTLFLLFFSLFSLQVSWGPETHEKGNHRGAISIGLGFSLLNKSDSEHSLTKGQKTSGEQVLFDSKSIALSSSALILMLLVWQLLAFNVTARKLSKL